MNLRRLVIPLTLALAVCYHGLWLRAIYTALPAADFKILGKLPDYEVPPSPDRSDQPLEEKRYLIPKQKLALAFDDTRSIQSLGIGVIWGSSQWLCDTPQGDLAIHSTGGTNASSSFRDGLTLYQTGSIPRQACSSDLSIVVTKDPLARQKAVGWKSGEITLGAPSVIASYKNIHDFFSSDIRAFLSVIALLVLWVFSGSEVTHRTLGSTWYRNAIAIISLHFFASSSIFDFLLPNPWGLGRLLLLAAGTGGYIALILSSLEIRNQKSYFLQLQKFRSPIGVPLLALTTFFIFYRVAGTQIYFQIQLILGALLFILSLQASAPSQSVTGGLLVCDVLAAKGLLPGLPTNTTVHFLILSFLYDSFEWLFLNNRLIRVLNHKTSTSDLTSLLLEITERFEIRRISVSMFTRDFQFRTRLISRSGESIIQADGQVSQLSASVMTARTSLLRVQVGSRRARILKGEEAKQDRSRGSEFSIFPLVHAQKVLGTLNCTNYPKSALADSSQLALLTDLIERLLPRLSEASYRVDLSPNVDEQASVLELESRFSASSNKSLPEFLEGITQISRALDCKIIISRYLASEDRMSTFSTHRYSDEDAKTLETHSARVQDSLVTSPTTVAIRRKMTVYIDDIQRMFSIYSQFLIQLLTRNETKSLLVAPVLHGKDPGNEDAEVWGVIWMEFPNRLNRPESDLRDLAEFAAQSIQRQLITYLDSEGKKSLAQELGSLVPEHVLRKLRRGENPREVEEGYLLNIDLAGSTKLAGRIGDQAFSELIQKISSNLSLSLDRLKLVPQLIIWDAFIYTRSIEQGTLTLDEANDILVEIKSVIHDANQHLPQDAPVSFRAVLHYGDTTRDWNVGSTRSWTISGAALAESCKLESRIKDQKAAILISEACPIAESDTDSNFDDQLRILKTA